MRTYTANSNSGLTDIVASAFLAGLALVLMATPADARSTLNRSISLASQEWMLVEQMTNGTMLAVLGIDTEENLREIQEAHELFDHTLRGLRDGDAEMGLVAVTTPEVLSQLDRVEAYWPRYSATIADIVAAVQASSDVEEAYIRELEDIHTLMIGSVDDMIDAFEQYSHGGETHSILSTTLNGSGQLRNFPQLMLGEMLAIAYHYHEAENREQLGLATRNFERTLTGLINGDAELRLLPAPNEDIGAELYEIQQLWTQVRPILLRVSSGEAVDERSIATVSHVTHRMIEPLNTAVHLYENL